ARASRRVPVYSVAETWRRHRRGCFAVAPAFGVRRLVAAFFRERKPTRCGFARAASKGANKLGHSKRCCDRQTRTFTPYVSCPQCAKHRRTGTVRDPGAVSRCAAGDLRRTTRFPSLRASIKLVDYSMGLLRLYGEGIHPDR